MKNDNRKYTFPEDYNELRLEYDVIISVIPENSSVIDLGCGDGRLLSILKAKKCVKELGVDISEEGILACRQKGLNVLKKNIDEVLPFADNSFDFAICNVSIQMVMYPELLLKEMKRISKYQIISFPNFAFYKNRLDLLFNGRMPKPLLFGYNWYNTGHIHQFSVSDFESLVNETGNLKIEKLLYVETGNSIKNKLMQTFPNLFQYIPIYLLKKMND